MKTSDGGESASRSPSEVVPRFATRPMLSFECLACRLPTLRGLTCSVNACTTYQLARQCIQTNQTVSRRVSGSSDSFLPPWEL